MDLISWSLNAIDKIISTRRRGSGEPTCPDGTFPAGYTMDAWGKWRSLCLAVLDIEDVEDVYLIGFMIAGLLSLGLGLFLIDYRIKKTLKSMVILDRKLNKIGFDVKEGNDGLNILREVIKSDKARVNQVDGNDD